MKIVVTGASGFVGSKLVDCLRESNDLDIIAVSRTIADDQTYTVKNYCDTPTGDVLVHLAEDSDRHRVNIAGEAYYQENEAVMKSLTTKDYGLIIYASSAVVYGEKGQAAYCEGSQVDVVDNYTRIKLNNEKSVLSSGGVVARFANVIGPGMANNNVLSDILAQIPGRAPLTVKNDCPIRDFVWVTDVVEGVIALIRKNASGIFNIGSGKGVSIRELVKLILRHAGEYERDIVLLSSSECNSFNVVDISKIDREVGWKPRFDINDSIKLLISGEHPSKLENK